MTTFAAKVSFEENCQLNEYLKRAVSTSDAFELVLNQLREIERQTGRPFVLLVYGDHQPWSFTEGIYSVPGGTAAEDGFKDFSDVRTSADGYQTFFHLLASDHTVVRNRFTKPPPASLLPTLVSAFVATSYDDLYLPVNFLAYASCGSDIRASGCDRYADIARLAKETLLTEPASRALPMRNPPSRVVTRGETRIEKYLMFEDYVKMRDAYTSLRGSAVNIRKPYATDEGATAL